MVISSHTYKKKYSYSELDSIAKEIITQYRKPPIYCFSGEIGTGKTTLIHAICSYLGIPVHQLSSPTFPIINVYEKNELIIYHLDLYRIQTEEELEDLGINEIFQELTACRFIFIEWCEKITAWLKRNHLSYYLIKLCSIKEEADRRIISIERR